MHLDLLTAEPLMSSIALTQATSALALAGTLQSTQPHLQVNSAQEAAPALGYHWSCYVLGFGALASLVAGVAAAILNQSSLIAPCAIIAITNTLGAYYIHKLSLYKNLEFYIGKLAEKIHSLVSSITQLKSSNSELLQANSKLDSSLVEYKQAIELGKKALGEKISEMQAVSDKLEHIQGELAVLQNLSVAQQATCEQLAHASSVMAAENSQLKASAANLQSQIAALSTIEIGFHSRADSLKDAVAKIAAVVAASHELPPSPSATEVAASTQLVQCDLATVQATAKALESIGGQLKTSLDDALQQESKLTSINLMLAANSKAISLLGNLILLAKQLQKPEPSSTASLVTSL